MDFKKSAALVSRFEYVAETGSTNSDLVAAALATPADFPNFSVLVAGSQTAGRGRSNRVWVSAPNKSLAISVLLRNEALDRGDFGWLPLIAGVAMKRAVRACVPASSVVILKWPNDVQVGGKKISGILSELLPNGGGVVIGAGINLTLEAAELPIEAATSLLLEQGNTNPDEFLATYLAELQRLLADVPTAKNSVASECGTIGLGVKAMFPDGTETYGDAVGLDESGRLLISVPNQSQLLAVSAADIQHLRHN